MCKITQQSFWNISITQLMLNLNMFICVAFPNRSEFLGRSMSCTLLHIHFVVPMAHALLLDTRGTQQLPSHLLIENQRQPRFMPIGGQEKA